MLGKLAVRNVKRQTSSYMIYFITVIFTVALMFAVNNVVLTTELAETFGEQSQESAKAILNFIVVLITLVVGFIICYATAFLLRKRKKELGVYLLLGVKRSAVLRVFIIENLIIGACSFVIGCILGLGVFQIINAFICGIIGNNFGSLNYVPSSIWLTLIQWAVIFLAAIVYSARIVRKSKIGDLLKEKAAERKQPNKLKIIKNVRIFLTVTVMAAAAILLGWLLSVVFDIKNRNALYANNMSLAVFSGYIFGVAACLAVLIAGIFIVPKKRAVERAIAVSMIAVIAAICAFGIWMLLDAFSFQTGAEGKFDDLTYNVVLPNILILLVAAIFIFYFFSRSFYSNNLNKPKKLKGSNLFHYRQMTSALSSNAAMMGAIAVLLSLAIFFSNFVYSARFVQIEEVNRYTQFDATGYSTYNGEDDAYAWAETTIEKAEKYSPVTFSHSYGIYHSVLRGLQDWYQEERPWFLIIRQDDLNTMIKQLGREEVAVANNGFYVLHNYFYGENPLAAGSTINLFGQVLSFQGEREGYEYLSYGSYRHYQYFIVVQDTLLTEPEWAAYLHNTSLVMNTKGYLPPEFYNNFGGNCRYKEIDIINANSATMIVSVLYLAVVFMFFAMALLSLKVMSDSDRDKKRYAILNMLGVGAAGQRKILFRQISAFFLTPMLIPALMAAASVVFSAVWAKIMLGSVPAAIFLIGAAVPLIFFGIYACYLGATYYLSAKNNIGRQQKPQQKLSAEEYKGGQRLPGEGADGQ